MKSALAAAAVVIAAIGIFFAFALRAPQAATPSAVAGSVVKLMGDKGHGSGVHIGGGYVISAEHVTKGKAEMAYLRDDGKKGTATVLWGNDKYDISLLKLDTINGIEASALECRAPAFGEVVSMRGNPMMLNHITLWGRVAGLPYDAGVWPRIVPIDGSMAPGMSGGAVFDLDGDVVGINVGALIRQMGFGGTQVGISAIVPGDVVCDMLARPA